MKKDISSDLFFSVMRRGICKAFRQLGRLIGYKEGETYFKVLWRMSALSITVFLVITASVLVTAFVREIVIRKIYREWICDSTYYNDELRLGASLLYQVEPWGPKKRVYDIAARRVVLKDIDWLVEPGKNDSLSVFAKNGWRGYINVNTGRISVEPDTYRHAWVFSDDLAAVEKQGRLVFIDHDNKAVIDNGLKYNYNSCGYMFNNGYCVVENQDDISRRGLIDKTGNWALDAEYDDITAHDSIWIARRGTNVKLLSSNLDVVREFDDVDVFVNGSDIYVTDADHMVSMYNLDGVLVHDNMVNCVEDMLYSTGEIMYSTSRTYNEEGMLASETENDCETNVNATALCKKYQGAMGWYGLMSADGRLVTKPIYRDIEAIGRDLYLCKDESYTGIILNGRGERIR